MTPTSTDIWLPLKHVRLVTALYASYWNALLFYLITGSPPTKLWEGKVFIPGCLSTGYDVTSCLAPCSFWGVCLQREGVCLQGGLPTGEGQGVEWGGVSTNFYWWPMKQTVRILLECILVLSYISKRCHQHHWHNYSQDAHTFSFSERNCKLCIVLIRFFE